MVEKGYADKFNIMVIGDEKVGKTTVLERHFNRKFNAERKKTIGVEYHNKDWTDKRDSSLVYNMKFWDTAGQEKFRSITKNYYQRAHGMLIAMSIDYRTSFDNLKMWVNSVSENISNSKMPLVIICNKIDLEDQREVDNNEVEAVANELGLRVFFTSAKIGTNIDEAFEYVMDEVVKVNAVQNRNSNLDLSNGNDKKSGCC